MTAQSDVSSNALNFPDFVKSSVDPRTGQYTVSIDLPELKGNLLAGPYLPLTLAFSPLNPLDTGFGQGWDLRLSQYNPDTGMLSLNSGESYKISSSDAEPVIDERKLFNFRFFRDADDRFRIVHLSGVVEVLKTIGSPGRRVALPQQIHAPLGHRLDLEYDTYAGHPCLKGVRDAHGELLRIERDDFSVKLLLPPFDADPPAVILMRMIGRRVMEIVLPTDDQASWRFDYGLFLGKTCITEVQTPLGGREVIEYRDGGHPYPISSGRGNLPRVTRHQLDPGFGQPMIDIEYSYTTENFLGYGTNQPWYDNGLDQLYNVTHTYLYGSTMSYQVGGTTARTVSRRYNRFHLLVEELTQQNQSVKRVVNSYYDEPGHFDRQPAWFQLPKSVETRWEHADDSTRYRIETSHTRFDQYGNLLSETREDGSQRHYTYYDKDGEDGCPADPDGFVRHMKECRLVPAEGAYSPAAELVNRFRYSALQPLAGAPNNACLLRSEEEDFAVRGEDEELLNRSQVDYYHNPADALRHGRRQQVRDSLGGNPTSTIDFSYGHSRHARLAEETLDTVEVQTTFDLQQRTLSYHESLLHGEVLLQDDANGVEVLSRFDRNRRLVEETVAPGSDVEASRTFSHVLASTHGQQAMQIDRNVKGVLTRNRYDGLGRSIAVDHWNGQDWQTIYQARHDALGQLVSESTFDDLDGEAQTLTSLYEYDDWGEVCRTTRADGVIEVVETSPYGSGGDLQSTWLEDPDDPQQRSQLSVTRFNPFDKPAWRERYDDQGKVVGRTVYYYDGYGQCTRQDEELEQMTLTTEFDYDARGRVQSTRLPDQTRVTRAFVAHSAAELTGNLLVTPGDALEPEVCLGEQQFDGLDRLRLRRVGPRQERYDYDGGRTLVRQRTTPAGQAIDYGYEPNLSEQAKSVTAPDNIATYSFDRHDASIAGASNDQGQRQYEYNDLGHLQLERWIDVSGKQHETRYRTSLLGLPLEVEHDGVITTYKHDDCGRVECMTQGQLQARFEYDALGRQYRTTTTDLGSNDQLVSENHYDSLGRIHQRCLLLNDQPARTISHTWRDDDQLLERHLQMDGRSLLLETFTYDARGRMTFYQCSGERLPTDRYGNAIVSQLFLFDALDNIRRCVTGFADGSNNVASFTYADDDACQLREITNRGSASGYPASQSFAYDANGNQLNDELGQQLHYDSLGRLLKVTSADGSRHVVDYRYDGHQHLVASRDGDAEEMLRFYEGFDLSYTVQGGSRTLYFGHDGVPLGQQQVDDHERTMLLLTDASPSVIGESLRAGVREAAYSAYGEWQDERRLQGLMAFNGEPCEAATGWYLLGRGYRAYNPVLMRFHSPDVLSPFHEGGLNPYMYCLGNPVRFHDPSGHRSTRRPGSEPIYTDPVVQPKKKKTWVDWIPVIIAAVATIAMIATFPVSAPFGVGTVLAMAGIGLSAAGTVVTALGVINDDQTLFYIGAGLGVAGGMIYGFGSSMARAAHQTRWDIGQAAKGLPQSKAPSPSLYKAAWRKIGFGGGKGAGGMAGAAGRKQSAGSVRSQTTHVDDVPNVSTAGVNTTNAPNSSAAPIPSTSAGGQVPPASLTQIPKPVSTTRITDTRIERLGQNRLWTYQDGRKVPKFALLPFP